MSEFYANADPTKCCKYISLRSTSREVGSFQMLIIRIKSAYSVGIQLEKYHLDLEIAGDYQSWLYFGNSVTAMKHIVSGYLI